MQAWAKANCNKVEKQDNKGSSTEERTHKDSYRVMKYSKEGTLYESVVIAGLPVFACITNGKLINVEAKIEENHRVLYPYGENAIEPYSFATVQELGHYLELARQESLDSLWYKVECTVRAFNDAEDRYIKIITGDIIFTYFQDKIGMTHYLFPAGRPGTGKGSILGTIYLLGYRAVQISAATAPNIYRLLGSIEKGQVTILIDEANTIENDNFLMEVCKTGYKGGGKVPRLLDSSSVNCRQEFYYTYCFKVIAAERLPSEWKAEGLLERCFRISTARGTPKYRVDKVIETGGDPKYEKLKEQIIHLRKLLFAYRLVHFSQPILDVRLNIDGREEELSSPLIRLFRDAKVLPEIKTALRSFIAERSEAKEGSLPTFLHGLVSQLIDAQNTTELDFSLIWETLKDLLKGRDIDGKPQSMLTEKYGRITYRQVTAILTANFHAKRNRDTSGNKRVLIFDRKKLEKAKIYVIPEEIEILPPDTSDTFDTLWEETGSEKDDVDDNTKENQNQEQSGRPASSLQVSETSEVSEKDRVKQLSPSYTQARVSLFLQKCEELAQISDNRIIHHGELHQSLLGTNYFCAGDATQIISDAVKAQILEEVEWHVYRLLRGD